MKGDILLPIFGLLGVTQCSLARPDTESIATIEHALTGHECVKTPAIWARHYERMSDSGRFTRFTYIDPNSTWSAGQHIVAAGYYFSYPANGKGRIVIGMHDREMRRVTIAYCGPNARS